MYAGVYLAFALATAAWQAWVVFLGYALFYGLTEPAEKTLVANLVGRERKGLAYGWGAALALLAVVLLIGVREQRMPPRP